VTFRWKDYAHHNKRRTMTLTHEVFLRRFLEHVLRELSAGVRTEMQLTYFWEE
jgi:hypothetical protein